MGGGRERNHYLQYHIHLIPEDVQLKDAVAYAYVYSMQMDVDNKRVLFLSNEHLLYLPHEMEGADDKIP